jgi:N-methylhydantoinase A
MRYVGQAFQIEVPLDPAWLGDGVLDRLRAAFHDQHERLYAHADRAADVELIDLRATVTGLTPKPELRPLPPAGAAAPPAARRSIHYRRQRHEAAVYQRRDLRAGHQIAGPAIVEQDDTTTLVPADWRGEVDALGHIVLVRKA